MSKCRHKRLALISAEIWKLTPDQEPFESGVIEKVDEINTCVQLRGHYCPDCEKLVDIEIEEQL